MKTTLKRKTTHLLGLSLLSSSLLLASCTKQILHVSDILESPKNSWSLEFEHNESGRLDAVFAQIEQYLLEADKADELDQLLYYLRTYHYFAADNELTDTQKERLNNLLLSLADHENFFSSNGLNDISLRMQENYLVALYLYFSEKSMYEKVATHKDTLLRILEQFTDADINQLSEQAKFTLWETTRSIAFLAYEARRNEKMKASLVKDSALADSLLALTAKQKSDNWIFRHGIWSTAYLQTVSQEADAKAIDVKMMKVFDDAAFLNEEDKKYVFSNRYLVNSFRVQDECLDTYKDRCVIPSIDDALPINHKCSDSLFIRASQMTEKELNESCEKLTSQESYFHELLATQGQPTGDDQNTSLRVVIFDNYGEYNQYGSLTFNIHTNNGGMYIEGDPSKEGNQATFFSFEAFWERPEFSVWNLNHEYIHYLDGRFVKYGPFGHFPGKLVWWSEGLAEYVSKGDDNSKAFELLKDTPQDEWPTLEEEFATTYNDGLDRTYRWSYLTIRFLAEHDRENFQTLANHLKANDFESYERLLADLAGKHQEAYLKWQQEHLANYKPEPKLERTKPRKLYRYLYRDYLMPEDIKYSVRHRHID